MRTVGLVGREFGMLRSGTGGRHEEVDSAADGSPAISAYAVPTGTCQRDGMPGGDMRSVIGRTATQSESLAEPSRPDRSFPPASPAAREYAAQAHGSRPGAGALIRCRRQPAVALGTAGPGH